MVETMRLALITPEKSIRDAIKQLNENRMQILVVVDGESKLLGTVTDGDVRRTILNGVNLEEPVDRIMNKNPKFVRD
ncbi:MAG: CBS domain-containing protein, partial [Bacteroidota bacterium]